ncbi:MAG: T9SS type A sorting domain-containing protein [Bacteroidia bacterium]|nr:T9SS type A sorting domain-containing protein [Bacteroidia bacterium]
MKKNLQLAAMAFVLGCATLTAQTGRVAGVKTPLQTQSINSHSQPQSQGEKSPSGHIRCATQQPSAEWDAWFNQKVEEFKAQNANKTQMPNYTIPVVVHVIHSGQAVGTGANISAAQVQDQINILNADYAGTGLNSGNVPTVFSSLKANCNITFCLATKTPSGTTMAEPGIDRRHYNTIPGLAAPGSGYNSTTIDATIKPNTIWDPTRYCNMWVCQLGGGLLGYATFPAGTGLTGLSAPFGSATSDGVVMGHNYFGSIGSAASSTPYHKGRTTTHEVGHWLGLRHIWGDSNCGSDFCNDTPTSQQSNFGCPTHPYKVGTCSGNTTGEMFMNFMDYTDDLCMYMFTTDQRARMQTAMANGTYRSQLTTSAGTLCTLSAATPTSNFNLATSGCSGAVITPTNNSNGTPAPTYAWSSNPATGVTFNPNNTATNPGITFTNPGTYTISCVATNSVGNNSSSKVITITTCAGICNDTIMNVSNTSTLDISVAGADAGTPGCSPKAGYIFGSNCYDDLEKAEFFPFSSYSTITTPKITSAIVLFFKNGTQGTGGNASTPVSLKLYNGTMAGGPTGTTTPLGVSASNLGNITSGVTTTSVNYCGAPGIVYSMPIILPYKFNFATAVNAPATNGFFASITCPTAAGDTIVVMDDGGNAAGTNWELWSPSGWYNVSPTWGGFNASMAILPIMTCSTTSVNDMALENNVVLMPNPTTGLVTVAATLPNVADMNITVTNALGQIISETSFTNVRNNAFTVDLTGKENGVYFISITSGGEKVTKRVILTK